MKILKLKSLTLSLLATLLLTLLTTETNFAQSLTTINGNLYFKNNKQRFVGNGVSDLRYYSNNESASYLSLYNNKDIRLGRLYGGVGSTGIKYFGLTDADGNWSYLIANDSYTAFRINDENKMIIRNNGRVDLYGNADATDKPNTGVLEIADALRLDANEIITNTDEPLHINVNNNGDVIMDGNTFRVDASQDCVRIGDVQPVYKRYKLYVEKGILTEKIRVANSGTTEWADYVFEEDYDLNSLEEVENFVTENKHLPNVPSAEEVNKNGVDMVEMDATLLRQIEELWLHTIKLNERIQELEAESKAASN